MNSVIGSLVSMVRFWVITSLLLLGPTIAGCDSGDVADQSTEHAAAAETQANLGQSNSDPNREVQGDVPSSDSAVDQDLMPVFAPWTGDAPAMIERRIIRALVPWSDTYFYLDGAQQRGIAYEAMAAFETWLNDELKSQHIEVHVVILPVRRDQLLPFIAEGRGDVALGGITITDERKESVDFTEAASKEVEELLVASSTADKLAGIDDLAGREVHIRRSSSYWDSLERLNTDFAQRGLSPIVLKAADEYLSTEDLLHMTNAGAIPYTIADNEIAVYFGEVLPDMRVRQDIVVRSGARYGWALRKNSPEFLKLLNRFLDGHRAGTLLGNVVINRYLKDTTRLHNIHGDEEKARFQEVYKHFEEHAEEYDFDSLMMVAQGFQESRLDQSLKSNRGAVGIMQLLPTTAEEPAVAVDDISTAENNILAGIRYMAWIRDTYFTDPALTDTNRTLLSFASYNAGPNRIRGLREKAKARGLDPDAWFDNVELIAAEDIGSETVDYVSNIYKYYVAYKLSEERAESM